MCCPPVLSCLVRGAGAGQGEQAQGADPTRAPGDAALRRLPGQGACPSINLIRLEVQITV